MTEFNAIESPVATRTGFGWIQAIILAFLFVTPVFFVLRFDQVSDTDIWWHLGLGRLMVEHGAIPRTEPFANIGAGHPFEAYSWLFELILYWLYQKLGLLGIVVYSGAMAVSITAAIHHLLRRLNSDFILGIGITFLAMYTMARLYTPRPWLISMLFFAFELDILMRARKTGKSVELLWLPLIFAVWTNIHIQFVDGLVVLGIPLAEAILAKRWPKIQNNFRVKQMTAVFAGCLIATLLNPYGAGIYKVAYDLVAQGSALNQSIELSAIAFRSLDDWCVVFFVLAATVVLAKAKRPSFFDLALLAFSIVVSFRTQRDIWVVAIAGAAILAANLNERPTDRYMVKATAIPLIVAATIAFAVLAFAAKGVNNTELQVRLRATMPVQAAETIKQQGWSGPIYNDYSWGGYLIWSLRMPVSMYGRNTVYGVDMVLRSIATWSGFPGWDSDPQLLRANLIIAQRDSPLVQLLRPEPCLQPAYQDNLSVVFIPRAPSAEIPNGAADAFCRARQAELH